MSKFNIGMAIARLEEKFNHINPNVLFHDDKIINGRQVSRKFNIFREVIDNDLELASTFGPAEQGYARLSMLTDAAFHSLFPGAELECFSSPLSSHITNYCSLSDKTGLLGSKGDIMKYNITESNIAAHPPNNSVVVSLFIDKLRTQQHRQYITLRLFVPDWDDIDTVLGDFVPYVIDRKYYSRAEIAEFSMMLNGNPRKFGMPWVPQKDRVLITFLIPPNVSDTVVYKQKQVWKSRLEILPEVSEVNTPSDVPDASTLVLPSYVCTIKERAPVTHEEHIELAVRMLVGISDPVMKIRGDTLYHQLLLTYTGVEYPIEEVADVKKDGARANLRLYVQQFLPQLSHLDSLSVSDQSNAIRQAMSMTGAFSNDIDSKRLFNLLDAIYTQWVDCQINDADLILLYTLWIEFESKVLDLFLSEVCCHLSAIDRNRVHLEYLADCPLSDLIRPACHTTGVTYSNPLSILTISCESLGVEKDLLIIQEPISSVKGRIDAIFYTANVLSDFMVIDNILDYSSVKYTSFVVVSHDFDAASDIASRHPDNVLEEGSFHGQTAYYVFLLSRYNIFSNDDSVAKIADVIDCTDLVTLYKNLSSTNVSLLHLAESVYKNKWLWFKNDFNWIMDPIVRYLSIAFHERTYMRGSPLFNPLRGARALHWAICKISSSARALQLKRDFAISHPLVVHCGGDGVDLYLNNLPHNLSTLMFMHEEFDAPIDFPPFLTMNMLNRKITKIGKLLIVSKFTSKVRRTASVLDPNLASNSRLDTLLDQYVSTSFVATYKWIYNKKSFHSHCHKQSNLELLNVFFFQTYNLRTRKYIVIQVLHVRNGLIPHEDSYHTGHFLHFYLPHDRTARYQHEITKRFIFPYLRQNKVSQLSTLVFQALSTVDINDPGRQYFPNIHVERQIDNKSEFGVNLENYYSLFDSNQGLVDLRDFMEEMLEMRKARQAPCDWTRFNTSAERDEHHRRIIEYQNLQIPFGSINRHLNDALRATSVQGWSIGVCNVVPMYYPDVYRDMSSNELTLSGSPINHHTARLHHDGMTVYTCPGSNYVWNCRLGQLLSAAVTRVSKIYNDSARLLDVTEWWIDNRLEQPDLTQYAEILVPKSRTFRLTPSSFVDHIEHDASKVCKPLVLPNPNPGYYDNTNYDDEGDSSGLDAGDIDEQVADDVMWGRDRGML